MTHSPHKPFLVTVLALTQALTPLTGAATTYRFDRLVKDLRVTTPSETQDPVLTPIDPPIATPASGEFMLSANELVFGQQAIGTTSDSKSMLLTNTSSRNLPILSIIKQGSAPFTVTDNCPAELAPLASCEISATFSPTTKQAYEDNVLVQAGSGQAQFSLKGEGSSVTVPNPLKIGFYSLATAEGGNVQFAALSGKFSNTEFGLTATNRYLITSNAENPGLLFSARTDNPDFRVIAGNKAEMGVNSGLSGLRLDVASCGGTLSNGTLSNCKANAPYRNGYYYGYFAVRFSPSVAVAGTVTGNLIIEHNATNQPSPYVIPLSALVKLTAVADVSTTSLTLDSAPVGIKMEKSFSVLNTGQGALTVNDVVVEGANAADFQARTSCAGALAGFSQCDVTVEGTPSATGLRQATVKIVTSAGTKTVTVYMTGQEGIASLTPAADSSSSFGTSVIGVTKTRSFVLANAGDTALTGLSALVQGTAGFALSASSTCASTLEPGASCIYVVSYTPVSTGEAQATLTVTGTGKNLPAAQTLSAGLPYDVVTLNANNVRTWSDGTLASSCYTYLNPTSSSYRYLGDVGSGFYRIKPNTSTAATDVYCDMVNDGGGWTLVLGGPRVGDTRWKSSIGAFGSTLQGPTATSLFKLADSFINAVPAANVTPARYRFVANFKGTVNTRFVGKKTYDHDACGATAQVTSWSNQALTTGAKSGAGSYSTLCGFSDYHWDGVNRAYLVTNDTGGNAIGAGANAVGMWGSSGQDVTLYMYVR